jgi:hypothetical protein
MARTTRIPVAIMPVKNNDRVTAWPPFAAEEPGSGAGDGRRSGICSCVWPPLCPHGGHQSEDTALLIPVSGKVDSSPQLAVETLPATIEEAKDGRCTIAFGWPGWNNRSNHTATSREPAKGGHLELPQNRALSCAVQALALTT